MVLVDTAGLRRRTKVAGTVDLLRPAALRARGRARRRGAGRLRRRRGRHLRGPAGGRAGDDVRVRHARRPQQVGHRATTDLEDATARLAKRRPPAPAGDHLLGARPGAQLAKLLARRDRARRPARLADPDAGAEPVRRRRWSPRRRRPPRRGRRLRLYYAAQVGRRPPRFAIQVNDRRLITRDWAYHLENRLRERYGLEGVPLVIDFVPACLPALGERRAEVGSKDDILAALGRRLRRSATGSPTGLRRGRACGASPARSPAAPPTSGPRSRPRPGAGCGRRRRGGGAALVLAVIARTALPGARRRPLPARRPRRGAGARRRARLRAPQPRSRHRSVPAAQASPPPAPPITAQIAAARSRRSRAQRRRARLRRRGRALVRRRGGRRVARRGRGAPTRVQLLEVADEKGRRASRTRSRPDGRRRRTTTESRSRSTSAAWRRRSSAASWRSAGRRHAGGDRRRHRRRGGERPGGRPDRERAARRAPSRAPGRGLPERGGDAGADRRPRPLAAVAPLVSPGRAGGAAAALVATEQRIRARGPQPALDPERARRRRGSSLPSPRSTPACPSCRRAERSPTSGSAIPGRPCARC